MSTEQQANGKIAEKNEKVAEVTEKLGNLAVDNNNKANEAEPARRGGRPTRGRAGRGRGGRAGRTFQPRPPYDEQVKQIEEELKTKKVLETGVKGYVKWFSVRGRYGFVARGKAPEEGENEKNADEKPDDFFVHQTAILKSSTIKYYLRTLDDDEPVVFDIVEGRKGPEAANVTGPDGDNVRGSRFARQLLSRWSAASGRRGPPKGERKARTDAPEDGEKVPEESADGEVRASKRRPRRARGKLQPTAENGADGAAAEKQDKEKGDGDAAAAAAAATGEKKGRRRNNKKGGKKEDQGEQPAAEPAAAQA